MNNDEAEDAGEEDGLEGIGPRIGEFAGVADRGLEAVVDHRR
jgi:hypothetical protein